MGRTKPVILKRVLFTVSLFTAVITAFLLVDNAQAGKKSRERLNTVRNTYEKGVEKLEAADDTSSKSDVHVDINELSAASLQIKNMQEKNPELAGWLKIPGTGIDHPVMLKENDTEFYLSHGFDRKEDKNGCLTLDGRTSGELSDDILIIHGHNLRSGEMFGSLKDYLDESFLYRHDVIELDTGSDRRYYQIIAVVLTTAEREEDGFSFYDIIDFRDEEEFQSFIDRAKQASVHRIAATALYGTKLMILSTCEYSRNDGRLLVIAKQMPALAD